MIRSLVTFASALTIAFSTTALARANKCAAIFAGQDSPAAAASSYVLTAAGLSEIQARANGSLAPDNLGTQFLTRSPEFLLYQMLEYRRVKGPNNHLFQQNFFLNSPQRAHVEKANPSFAGVDPALVAEWRKVATDSLKRTIQEIEARRPISIEETDLILYFKVANPLKPDQLKTLIRGMAAKSAAELAEGDLSGVYQPKIFQLSKNLLRRKLGMSWLPLTDVVTQRDGDTIKIRVVALEEIARRANTVLDNGLHIAEIQELNVPKSGGIGDRLIDKEISWAVGGKRYTSKIEIRLGPSTERIAPALKTIDFAGMWKDKKLAGVILSGSNMREDTDYVVNEYKSYYQSKGYRFSRPAPVASFKEFLQRGISSGEIDYMLKEAHSEGNDRLLTTLVDSGDIVTGRKSLPGGKQEIIYLYYPKRSQQRAGDGESLEYAELARWIAERDKNGNAAQLAYLDTSCFGLGSACHLITATKNSKLIVIGTSDTAETFTDESDTALRYILDGIREKKTFAEIRADLREHAPSYKNKDENTYRFPDDKEWRDTVVAGAGRSADINIQVFDQDGKPFNIETLDQQ